VIRVARRRLALTHRFNSERRREELMVRIGLHDGPCFAVTLNERLDYFSQTVNISARASRESPEPSNDTSLSFTDSGRAGPFSS
jgi:class 3 adenylate cyclase